MAIISNPGASQVTSKQGAFYLRSLEAVGRPYASSVAPRAKGRMLGCAERGRCLTNPMNQADNCVQLSHSAIVSWHFS